MSDSNYSLAGLHLPERKLLTNRLQAVSFIINDIVLTMSLIVLAGWATHITIFEDISFGFLTFSPAIAAIFILAGETLLFNASLTTLKKSIRSFWTKVLPVICGLIVTFSGIASVFNLMSSVPSMIGFNFFLLGLALIFPHIKFTHRFHITQFIISLILTINAIAVLGEAYQFLSPFVPAATIYIPLNISILFISFSAGVLMRWSNRGFLGSFTAQSPGSTFAFRLLIINLIITPFIGFFTLILIRNGLYMDNIYQIIALTITLIMVATTTLAWFNIKLLYKFELEHFLMKETLRIHNIDIKMDKEQLEAKMEELEQSKQKYLETITYQDKFRDVAERFD